MASAIWPVGLPQAPLVRAYSQRDESRVIRSQMETGLAKARPRSTAIIEVCTIEILLTRAQVAILKNFFRDTLAGGALPFQWKHFQTGNLITGNLIDYRFKEPPETRPRAPRQATGTEIWVASFQLETIPGTEIEGEIEPPIEPIYMPGGGDFFRSVEVAAVEEGEPDLSSSFQPLTFEADAAPPEFLIEILSGAGSGFRFGEGVETSDPSDPEGFGMADALITSASGGGIGVDVGVIPGGGFS